LLSELGIGTLSYATPQGTPYVVAVHGGYVEILDNHVRVLADMAEPGQEIDIERAKRDLERAQQSLNRPGAPNPADGSDPAYGLSAAMSAEARLEAARKAALGEE
jgi:F-type H+-transporting ATPase subunit epsilon